MQDQGRRPANNGPTVRSHVHGIDAPRSLRYLLLGHGRVSSTSGAYDARVSTARVAAMARGPVDGHHAINFAWVLRLRWWAIFGQVVVIFATEGLLSVELPKMGLLALVATSVAVNVVGGTWANQERSMTPLATPALMALDVLLLTGLLFLTGGPENPFSSLYIVHVALSAVVLPPIQTWGVVGLALGCHGALFLGHVPLSLPESRWVELGTLTGAWISFLVASVFIVYFVQRVTVALTQREAELARARELTVRSEKLASLATLSAGAAHELSTPLSTIAVVAKELEILLRKEEAPDYAVEDARLIRKQVARCRNILSQMATDAGDASGERSRPVTAGQMLELAQEGLPGIERVLVDVSPDAAEMKALLPPRAVAQALRSLIKNALQASTESVTIEVRQAGAFPRTGLEEPMRLSQHPVLAWSVRIQDRGEGMPEQVLARAGDPFFTTKEPGAGMGLGLFLSRAVIERFGGRLQLTSSAGQGTTALVILPLESDAEPLHVPYEPTVPSAAEGFQE